MPTYDEYREFVADSSAEQKLAILRSESRQLLAGICGYTTLILKLVEERGAPQMPPEFSDWCQSAAIHSQELADLVGALTDSKHRDLLRQEQEERERVRAVNFWKEEQADLPELQNYASFLEAVQQTALKLDVSLPSHIQITNFYHPSVMSAFASSERRVNIQSVVSRHNKRPIGYFVALSNLAADELHTKGPRYQGITRSLDEAVVMLHQWLVDKWSQEQMQQQHDWLEISVMP
jgi:hypothetical protein